MVNLGAFQLVAPRGRGGMAEVWEAVHGRSGLRVAVKVISGPEAADPRLRRALEREVQAMARLSHPWVVRVFDHGTLPADVPEGLVGGAPWFAMEWVDGTLEPHVGRLEWAPVRRILLRLLEALGHAHARGVLHRDVKPANVLVESVETWQVRLADFGIAHALDDSSAPLAAGTPAFMAPEQREGRWRRQGPWTDLFAVGRLAAALLAPDARVPRGWPAWIARMCARDSWDRPNFASEARDALLRMGPAALPDVREGLPTEAIRATTPAGETSLPDWAFDSTWVDFGEEPPDAPTDESAVLEPAEALVLASGWRETHVGRPDAVIDAGLGLCHLREPDVVARIAERDAMWGVLLDRIRDRSTGVITLRGPEGVGRTRLGDWLCDRAHEVGLAWPYRVQGAGPIAAVAAQALGVVGLAGAERAALCEEVAAGHGWSGEGVGRLLSGLAAGDLPLADAVGALTRLLAAIARRTPVLIFVDDAGDREEEALARELRERPELGPIVLVVAIRDPKRARAGEIGLAPLDLEDLEKVVQQIVPLEHRLRGRVVSWADGFPGVAVDQVRAWALAGRLRPGPGGYDLDEGPDIDGAGGAWAMRLDAFLATRSAAEAAAVELGAFLGRVREDEWREACAHVGADGMDLGGALYRAGLIKTSPEGGRFAHRSLAPLMIARATPEAAIAAHRVCADLLARVNADPGRIGRHRLAAGEAEAALPLLAAGARAALYRGALGPMKALLLDWDAAVAAAGVDPEDRRCVEGAILRLALAQSELTDVPRGHADAALLEARAVRHGWWSVAFTATAIQGRLASLTGRLPEAEEHFARARTHGDAMGEPAHGARCDYELGIIATRRGRPAEGEALLRRARATFDGLGDRYMKSSVTMFLAHTVACLGRTDEAQAIVEEGHAADVAADAQIEGWLVLRGEVARRRGDLDAAEAWYRQGAEIAALTGRRASQISCLANIGICDILRGRYDAAQVALEDALASYQRLHNRSDEGAVHVLLLACAAGTGDATAWSLHLAGAEQRLGETGYVDGDVLEALNRAIALAPGVGFDADLPRLERLAAAQQAPEHPPHAPAVGPLSAPAVPGSSASGPSGER